MFPKIKLNDKLCNFFFYFCSIFSFKYKTSNEIILFLLTKTNYIKKSIMFHFRKKNKISLNKLKQKYDKRFY